MANITSILWLSVILQCIAVFFALRLIPLTGRALAWTLLSVAFFLMAARRALSLLYAEGFLEDSMLRALSTEIVALLISALIVLGVFMIRKIFVQQNEDAEKIRTLSLAVEQNSGITIITDIEGSIEYVNSSYIDLTGISLESAIGQMPDVLNPNRTDTETVNSIWEKLKSGDSWEGEVQSEYRNETQRWERVSISPVKYLGTDVTHFVIVHDDVTKQKEHREQMEHMALHDALTNLPNRTLFNDRLEQAIISAKRSHEPLAVMLMDLNNFKEINDTMGHHVGDSILQEIGERLIEITRGADTIARMGGDEFLLLLPAAKKERQMQFLERITSVLEAPFEVNERRFEVSASIGYALYPEDGDEPEILLRHADVAMYSAKNSNSAYKRYNESLDEGIAWRLELFNSLRDAIDTNQFVLHYQPMVRFSTGIVDKVEALIRWNHPDKGLLYPNSFIPHAEQTHHIKGITHWVVKRVFADLRKWYNDGIKLGVSLNISARDLLDPELFEIIQAELENSEVPASLVTIEITESAIMMHTRHTMNNLFKLRDVGVMINIDDFGTGYSSLQHLKRMPVTGLKIDKAFVLNMINDDNDAIIVRSTTDLAHNMGLKVVAEGIEDQDVYDLLQILGCEYGQGYYIARPMNLVSLIEWLDAKQAVKTIETLSFSKD